MDLERGKGQEHGMEQALALEQEHGMGQALALGQEHGMAQPWDWMHEMIFMHLG